jgi:hypothetical protein
MRTDTVWWRVSMLPTSLRNNNAAVAAQDGRMGYLDLPTGQQKS